MTKKGAPPKGISAVKKYPRAGERQSKGENVQWKRIKSLDQSVLDANKIARDAASVIGRWLLYRHLTPFQAEAARRYAFIMARFDRHFTEGRRTARSPSYERAYGEDQELERRAFEGTMDSYEKSARKAKRQYDKLQMLLLPYLDIVGRNPVKEALDKMCCEDAEPDPKYRAQISAVLKHIGHEFDVQVQSRRGRPRKGKH